MAAPDETLTPDALLARWFWPHYPPDVRAAPFLHRDVDANPGGNPALVAPLAEAAELLVAQSPQLFGAALTYDRDGVATLARGLTRDARDRWIARSDPRTPDNLFFNVVVHASAFLGEVIVRGYGGRWELRRPLWESVVVRPAGGAIAPFHWLLKSLADDAIDELPLAVRWRLHVEMPALDPSSLPVLSARALPPIKGPTYHLWVKYMRQHLPAMRDVGEGFPSPEAFAARAFSVLTPTLLHGGRVLCLHGQTAGRAELPSAVEVMWLTADGFDHADVIPCDAAVPYFGRAVTDERLEISVSWQSRPHTHRLSLRGHG